VNPQDRRRAQAGRHKVSVVIPTVGRSTIEATKAALAAQTLPPDEVIVVVDSPPRGEAWARNHGFSLATGDIIASTDDDCVPPPDWLERLVDAIDRYDAAGAGGTFHETDPLLASKRARRRFPREETVDEAGCWVGNTGNVAYRRSWLEDCQRRDGFVFPPHLSLGVDAHLAWRLRCRGALLVYLPLEVRHMRRVTPRQYLTFQFRRGEASAWLDLEHRASAGPVLPIQRGILSKATGPGRWVLAAWRKLLGPFDVRSFHSFPEFLVFWLGEKCEAAGYVSARLRRSWQAGGNRKNPSEP
jgi:GT2 family glycosyltransferase